MFTTLRRSLFRALTLIAAMFVVTSGLVLSPAATGGAHALGQVTATKVIKIAASERGTPYKYGGTSPRRGFDCSGYTQWVFARAGKRLPRTSDAQFSRTRHVRRADRKRGDLVFFHNRGNVYHVGIYAGRGQIWHSPSTGSRVHKARIWTSNVRYGRVR